jgi:hypothetical protein
VGEEVNEVKKPTTAKMFRCRFKCTCVECKRQNLPCDFWQYTMVIANDSERAKARVKAQNPFCTDVEVFVPKAG